MTVSLAAIRYILFGKQLSYDYSLLFIGYGPNHLPNIQTGFKMTTGTK